MLDAILDELLPAALDDGGLQLGQVAGGGGIVPAGEVLPQGYNVVGDGAVQLQGGVGVQIGGQGVFQLLQLQALGLDLGHGLQGPGAVIGGGDDLALAHLLPLLPGGTQGPGIGAEGLLLPHQPAGGLHGVLRGAGIHPGGGVGVRQIPHPLDQEIEHHRRRQGNGQNFEYAGGFHGVTSFGGRVMVLGRCRAPGHVSKILRAQGFACGKALVRPVGRRRYCASDGRHGSYRTTGCNGTIVDIACL